MRNIKLTQPRDVHFGAGVFNLLVDEPILKNNQFSIALVATPLLKFSEKILSEIQNLKIVEYNFPGEPTFAQFDGLLKDMNGIVPDCVIGIGGGSVLDCAKLLATFADGNQKFEDAAGVGNITGRSSKIICIPSTSGTGSEMSPVAILLNEETMAKTGYVSPFLVPDVSYVDPELTLGLPAKFTAETGMDALSHCVEAYTNINAHPIVDTYALKGIELISKYLLRAVQNGNDIEARTAMSQASMYGGICLGPVNTCAVHALSYGLGGKYHISHGLANAILLPEVLKFNMSASVQRHADVALAMGIENKGTLEEIALKGIEKIQKLSKDCDVPQTLTEIGINSEDLSILADIALQVTRLLNNNPRPVSHSDAVGIYQNLI